MSSSSAINTLGLRWDGRELHILDQTLLPATEKWIRCSSPDHMVEIIATLKVRGAPLIGVAAALALGDYAQKVATFNEYHQAALRLRASRPTAVNLMLAIDKMLSGLPDTKESPSASWREQSLQTAEAILQEDIRLSDHLAAHGAPLIHSGEQILTHCNTGGLATAGIGTALGVIRRAHEQGKKIHVYVDETRPLGQGGRLTVWELQKLGIPHTLICDNMAAALMQAGKVDKIFVGADRIARNGDSANKIGTYSVAVLAKFHQIPFYIVAPRTTIDKNCPNGAAIPIEQRSSDEVHRLYSYSGPAPQVWNPAFDVTPAQLITGWVLDSGVLSEFRL